MKAKGQLISFNVLTPSESQAATCCAHRQSDVAFSSTAARLHSNRHLGSLLQRWWPSVEASLLPHFPERPRSCTPPLSLLPHSVPHTSPHFSPQVISDYKTPEGKSLNRDLTQLFNTLVNLLVECRPLSVSMGNAIKHIKLLISKVRCQ